jgi:hypothetical protein
VPRNAVVAALIDDDIQGALERIEVYFLSDETDVDSLRKADLNFDGIVNALDFSIMTASRINVADIK